MFTEQELEGRRKGYTKPWNEYVDIEDVRFILPDKLRAKIVEWCKPHMIAGTEASGGFVFCSEDHVDIRNVYMNGGKTQFLRTTCVIDSDWLQKQMWADYPELVNGFLSDRVGFWHLHPGYFMEGVFSVGDVEGCRASIRETGDPEVRMVQLLVYGDSKTGTFAMTGFIVSLDDVFRYKVTDGTQEART